MAHPHALTSLTPRECITDALYRAVIGFDRNDIPIFNSAFAGEDVSFELKAAKGEEITFNGLSNVREQVLAHVGPMDTTHVISNVRVDYKDGADTAFLTAYAMAQHCAAGKGSDGEAPKYMTGGEYWIDLVRDDGDGLWKIKKWVLDIIWRQGDVSVMQSPFRK